MKTCLLLSLVMLVQSKPGPKPKPEPKPNLIVVEPSPCQPWSPPCQPWPQPCQPQKPPCQTWPQPCQPQKPPCQPWPQPCQPQWPQPPPWPQPTPWPQPPPWTLPTQWPQPPQDSGCVCINPFLGKFTDARVNGDPDAMCRKNNHCYVDCNSMCRDVQNAKGFGRCFSKLACKGRVRGHYPWPGSPWTHSTGHWGKK